MDCNVNITSFDNKRAYFYQLKVKPIQGECKYKHVQKGRNTTKIQLKQHQQNGTMCSLECSQSSRSCPQYVGNVILELIKGVDWPNVFAYFTSSHSPICEADDREHVKISIKPVGPSVLTYELSGYCHQCALMLNGTLMLKYTVNPSWEDKNKLYDSGIFYPFVMYVITANPSIRIKNTIHYTYGNITDM